jgi:hypothetical protein
VRLGLISVATETLRDYVVMGHSRHNPFTQLVSLDAGWVSQQFGGSGIPNLSGWHHCRCPVHAGDSPSVLALKNAPSGGLFARCFKDCPEAEIHREIDRLLQEGRFDLRRAVSKPTAGTDSVSAYEQTVWAARSWHSCRLDQESPVRRYLRSRGVVLPSLPDTLRFHPNLTHKPSDQRWPAMVALAQDVEGQPRAVHRTWLNRDGSGKAPVEKNKMTLGPVSGCAIRLGEATDSLILAEGIESALSVTILLDNQPAWATLSTAGMKAVQLPPSIRTVTIAADNDAPGLEAAQTLCRRLEAEGRSVTIIRPNREGDDFNDVLREVTR